MSTVTSTWDLGNSPSSDDHFLKKSVMISFVECVLCDYFELPWCVCFCSLHFCAFQIIVTGQSSSANWEEP